jgi:hypothetical protein
MGYSVSKKAGVSKQQQKPLSAYFICYKIRNGTKASGKGPKKRRDYCRLPDTYS